MPTMYLAASDPSTPPCAAICLWPEDSSNCHVAIDLPFCAFSSRTRSRNRLPSSRPHEYDRDEGPARSFASEGAGPLRPLRISLWRPSQNLLGVQGKIGAFEPFGTFT